MEQFPANSHTSRVSKPQREAAPQPEPKKLEKVVVGSVVRRKKPLGRRLMETFVGGDTKSVWAYVLTEVLIPAAKDMIADSVSQGVERMVYGELRAGGRRSGGRPGGSNGYVSYNRYSSSPPWNTGRREEQRSMSSRARATHNFEEIVLDTRVEVEEVLDKLVEIVNKYGQATLGDLYQLVGITGTFMDDKWGWTDLRAAGATRVRNGYLLDLPNPDPID